MSFLRNIVLCILTLLFSYKVYALKDNSAADDSLFSLNSALKVYIFLAPDCPISLKYINTIRGMEANYNGQVAFVGWFPKTYSLTEIDEFRAEYNINFDLFIDDSNELIKEYHISVTPEVVLLESDKVLYQGAINNWFYELGKSRSKPTEFYLKDAIDSTLANQQVKIGKTKAIGCIISK